MQKSAPELPLFQEGALEIRRCKYALMLYSTADAYIGRALQLYGEYSEDDVRFFARTLKPGHTVLDVGANIGTHTMYFAGAVGKEGRVLAFEPLSSNFQLLCANTALNNIENVELKQVAVGRASGTVRVPKVSVTAPGNQGGFSLLDEPSDYSEAPEMLVREEVPKIPIDELNLARCHLIKADVEGMELDVVLGASATLKRCKPMLYLENNRQDKSSALIEALLQRDYACFWYLTRYFNENNFFNNAENVFPDMFEQNLIAVPNIIAKFVEGLEPVTSPDDWPLARNAEGF
ncbi:MAG: FkbM family methyltransferase [Proteobacteria bacterium]|nr:FkbM family methyltransferase [Pseudomonadota bacterium]